MTLLNDESRNIDTHIAGLTWHFADSKTFISPLVKIAIVPVRIRLCAVDDIREIIQQEGGAVHKTNIVMIVPVNPTDVPCICL